MIVRIKITGPGRFRPARGKKFIMSGSYLIFDSSG